MTGRADDHRGSGGGDGPGGVSIPRDGVGTAHDRVRSLSPYSQRVAMSQGMQR